MECAFQAPGIKGDLTMFNRHHKSDLQEIERFSCALTEANAKLAAISRSMAMIEFDRNGIILDANDNFCQAMGYNVEEIRGKHHRIFARMPTPTPRPTPSYGVTWRGAKPSAAPLCA